MQAFLKKLDRFFMEETSSVSVSLFRIPVALAVGAQILPTLLEFRDNYSRWAFITKNPNYFPASVIELVDKSPDRLVQAVAALFVAAWFFFLIGLFTQSSCIVMDLCANYLYCLNYTPHGMLSIDILLVTVFLMAVTPYPGDHFSVDALLRARKGLSPPKRPIFLVRLLQLQMAITYFHTGLCKLVPGNWWTDNPYWYVMSTPPGGIVRDHFFLKAFLAPRPRLCKAIGLLVVSNELAAPVLLFTPILRPLGLALGLYFQAMLFLSLHVPTTTFLFTFPFQIFLFIHPEKWERWLRSGKPKLSLAAAALLLSACAKPPIDGTIRKGAAVKLRYTLSAGGKELASTAGKAPLVYSQGSRQLPFDLEDKLEGMKVGEKRTVKIPPKKAFGKVNPKAFLRAPRSAFAELKNLAVGAAVQGQLGGRPFQATIAAVHGDEVLLDFNPPLAGKTLVFEAEVVETLPSSN